MKKNSLKKVVLFATTTIVSSSAYAALQEDAVLNFNPGVVTDAYYSYPVYSGSYFGIDRGGDGIHPEERTALSQYNGIYLGTIQTASGAHYGVPDGSESPNIDQPRSGMSPWNGLHFTNNPTTVLSASENIATVDFSGWGFMWPGDISFDLGSGAWQEGFTDGIAKVICAFDCAYGDTYTLDYSATIPVVDGFFIVV